MTLRPYQLNAVDETLSGFGRSSKQLGVLPTGAGKTIVFSEIAKRIQSLGAKPGMPTGGGRTLILAHREELVDQAIDKLYTATGIRAGKEMAGSWATNDCPVVVASIQTMQRRLKNWPADHFKLVVCDEAHHAISPSWQKVLNYFDPHAWVLGVTATPDRGDRKELGQYFENVPFEVSLFELINQGYLSRIAIKSVPLKIDLRSVRSTRGADADFNVDDLGAALDPYLDLIAHHVSEEAMFRRTLVFCPLIATSKKFVAACQKAGLNAAHVDGTSEDRAEIRDKFASGEIDLVSNAMLWTEGYDNPNVDCVVNLRVTKSRALYSQIVGRGTRKADGKSNLLLLDFLWMHEKHRLVRPAHLVAANDDEAEQITKLAENAPGGGQDELDLEELATDAAKQREARLLKELEAKAKRKKKFIDPVEFSMSLGSSFGKAEESFKDIRPPSSIQLERIKVMSNDAFDVEGISSAGQASAIISLLESRKRLGLATPKQIRFLRRHGHPNPDTCLAGDASKFIARVVDGRGRKTVAA